MNPLTAEKEKFDMLFLLTGASGYIGAHVGRLLVQNGLGVLGIDDFSGGPLRQGLPYEVVHADVRDVDKLSYLFRKHQISCVIHLAGKKRARESVLEAKQYMSVNVDGTQSLLKAMRINGVKSLVFSSSCAVYGNQTNVDEQSTLAPLSPYGATKVAAEAVIEKHAAEESLTATTLRFFNVVGCVPSPDFIDRNPDSILNRFGSRLIDNEPLPIYGNQFNTPDGTAVRDYVDVRDIARAHVLAAAKQRTQSKRHQVINLSSGRPRSVLEISKIINQIGERSEDYISVHNQREGDPSAIWGDSLFAEKILGWNPQINIIQSIKDHLDASEYRANGK